MACLPGLTWPGRKVPGGDVTSNLESLDSLPKADWWRHPNVTRRWRHRRYCVISGRISQSTGVASSVNRQPLTDHTVHDQPNDGCVGLSVDTSASSDSTLNQVIGFFCSQATWTCMRLTRILSVGRRMLEITEKLIYPVMSSLESTWLDVRMENQNVPIESCSDHWKSLVNDSYDQILWRKGWSMSCV